MTKKILSLVLAVLMVLSVLMMTGAASTTAIRTGYCGDSAEWALYDDGRLVVSGTGAIQDYAASSNNTGSTAPWYSSKDSVTSIEIQSGITSIGAWAFSGCTAATTVSVASTVTTIGDSAFRICSAATSIALPGSITTIAPNAFYGCVALADFNIPSALQTLGEYAFYGCIKLSSVTLPASLSSIGVSAFAGCEQLTGIIFNHSATAPLTIGTEAFRLITLSGNKATTVFIGDSNNINPAITGYDWVGSKRNVTYSSSPITIFFDANGGTCSINSKSVNKGGTYGTLPTPVRASYVFDGWYTEEVSGTKVTADTVVTVSDAQTLYAHWTANKTVSASGTCGANAVWTLYDDGELAITGTGEIYNYAPGTGILEAGSTAPWYESYNKDITSITIANGITAVGSYAFYRCRNATSIAIPSTVIRIGSYSFTDLGKITELVIPNSVTSIEESAFYRCTKLTTITFRHRAIDNLTIGTNAFALIDLTIDYPTTVKIYDKDNINTAISGYDWVTGKRTVTYESYSLTVTFDANGGSCDTSGKAVSYGERYGTLPTPTKEGCNFSGWYDAIDGGSQISSGTVVSASADHTLYAHWTAAPCTVSFDANGGSCAEASRTVSYGGGYGTMPEATRTGYRHLGWFTERDAGTQVQSTTIVNTTSDHTLYAHWAANTYTVSFDANGGSCTVTSIDVTYDSNYGTLPTPTLNGKAFQGWFTALDGGERIAADTKVAITAEQTLYAHWVEGAKVLVLEGIDAGGTETSVWIDGVRYDVNPYGEGGGMVALQGEVGSTAVVYSFNESGQADLHTQYPTGMKVWLIHRDESSGNYSGVRASQLDNLLRYAGSSIRIAGKKGIRMITGVDEALKKELVTTGVCGYKLVEYGTLVAFESQMNGGPLTIGQSYTKGGYAYVRGGQDSVFSKGNGVIKYTNVLVGFTMDQCAEELCLRPYMILEDANGTQITIYGGEVHRSIGYIAYQNRNAFQPKTEAYEYIWGIIHSVYGTAYDSEYQG